MLPGYFIVTLAQNKHENKPEQQSP